MNCLVWDQPNLFGTWAMQLMGGDWFPGRGQAIGELDEQGRPVSAVLYEGFNGASVVMHVAFAPGYVLSRSLLWMAFDYPFNQLRIQKLIGPVPSTNLSSRRFTEKLGFVLEATLKDAAPDGDLLLYTMNRSQCRWLNLKEPQNGQAQIPAAG